VSSEEQFQRRIGERDVFRLAIRGHAMIEDLIDAGLRGALVGGASSDIMKLQFSRRLELARSLGLIDANTKRLVHELGRIRNEFAHGRTDDLHPERARALVDPLKKVYPGLVGTTDNNPMANIDKSTPIEVLRSGLMGGYVAVDAAIKRAERERGERDAALGAKRMQDAIRVTLSQMLESREQASE
jgi:hypothetical protein